MTLNNVVKGYSFDDVLLVPSKSDLDSRSEVNLRSAVGMIGLDLPILSSPMDTVTEENMAVFMWESGGFGIIHRYNTVNKQYAMVKWVKEMGVRVGAAVGINHDAKERVDALLEAGVDLICIDIAHGDSQKAYELVAAIRDSTSAIQIMSGNIVTEEAAIRYLDAGADVLRVGVGPGSACSTRVVAGVGYPQLSAISNVKTYAERFDYAYTIVADGGIRTSGDVVKALAAGADAVMVGGILAPFVVAAGKRYSVKTEDESPLQELFPAYISGKGNKVIDVLNESGKKKIIERYVTMKEFRGMASEDALKERKDRFVIEGESFLVEERNDQREFLAELRDGIQQGFAYLGARNIYELRANAEWVEVTPAGLNENAPHFDKGVKK
jgi:IMP dehydrogenase/GMP reductase